MPSNDLKKCKSLIQSNLKKGCSILLSSLFLCFIGCSPKSEQLKPKGSLPNSSVLEKQLDNWHLAAANADSAQYFDFISSDGRFLGTDASENWSKAQFLNFSTPYFQKGKAWSFTGYNRNWYYSKDSSTVWFDERLNTWMGECRGSGVMIFEDSKPKLAHYNLAVTIANEKIQEFIALSKESEIQ
jgi:hypothetical protein